MKIKKKDAAVKVTTTKTTKKAVSKAAAEPKPAAPKKAAPKTRRVTFSIRAETGCKVFLAGDFNNWNPAEKEMLDKKGDGVYTATLNLEPGEYQYKFVIDGTWCADPECTDWLQNDHGTLNSVRRVD